MKNLLNIRLVGFDLENMIKKLKFVDLIWEMREFL